MTILGPVPCMGCRLPVVWDAHRWRHVGKRGRLRLVCSGPLCGALMKCGERCARTTGHGSEHRTGYALENARLARTGHAVAATLNGPGDRRVGAGGSRTSVRPPHLMYGGSTRGQQT